MCADRPDDDDHMGEPADGEAAETEPNPAEAARWALARAREAARAKGLRPGSPGHRTTRAGAGLSGRSGPRTVPGNSPDPATVHGGGRDPQPLAALADQLSRQLGWSDPLSVGGVMGRWPEVVGPQIAEHCTPLTFEEGALVVQADSTAWATQLRLLLPQLERRLAEEVGEGVVTSIQVLGPGGPSWRKGKRSVRGRGPRDTYG